MLLIFLTIQLHGNPAIKIKFNAGSNNMRMRHYSSWAEAMYRFQFSWFSVDGKIYKNNSKTIVWAENILLRFQIYLDYLYRPISLDRHGFR